MFRRKKKKRGILSFLSYPELFSREENEEAQESEEEKRVTEPRDALPPVKLGQLPEKIRQGALRIGWTELSEVQSRVIPYVLAGRDLFVQCKKGSGKTGAFLLPLLEKLDLSSSELQALILVPNRELAEQIARTASKLGKEEGLNSAFVYGGVPFGPQLTAIKEGVQVIVGTPGRVLDLLLRRAISLASLRILVIDEADRIVSMGFYPDMRRIKAFLPSNRFNVYVFSESFPLAVKRLAEGFAREYAFLAFGGRKVEFGSLQHVYYVVPAMEKDRSLIHIIEVENPANAVIFCNTQARSSYVATVLSRFGYGAEEVKAEAPPEAIKSLTEGMQAGRFRFLVAPDPKLRDIKVEGVSHIFNYEVPEDPEVYIQRSGVVGEGAGGGTLVSLVSGIEEIELKSIADRYGLELEERPLPSETEIAAVVSERLTAYLESRMRSRDALKLERMQRFMPLANSLSESQEGKELIAMLLDDYYQETLQSPPHKEEKEPGGTASGRRRRRPSRKRKTRS